MVDMAEFPELDKKCHAVNFTAWNAAQRRKKLVDFERRCRVSSYCTIDGANSTPTDEWTSSVNNQRDCTTEQWYIETETGFKLNIASWQTTYPVFSFRYEYLPNEKLFTYYYKLKALPKNISEALAMSKQIETALKRIKELPAIMRPDPITS